MNLQNSQGKVYYGMHFYPGVAEYQEPGKEPYRVYLNENTIRSMDPTFAARPIFVEHVDEVDPNLSELRKEAKGWVVESFYNDADGKHWVKFITVSDEAEKAIRNGFRLSNAYVPKSFGQSGQWNGVDYLKEITSGEYEHLALVRNPRYAESVVLTPEEFKKYNEDNRIELKRLSNSQDKKGESKMGFSLFKKTKVENGADITGMSVLLPKSKKEVSIETLINDADEKAVDKNAGMADPDHKVKLHDGSYCNVAELVAKHKAMNDELEAMKKDGGEEIEEGEKEVGDRGGDKSLDNEEEDEKKKNDEEEAKKKKSMMKPEGDDKPLDDAKKKNAKDKADRLRNAQDRDALMEVAMVEFSGDQVARGKKRYGSN